MEHGGAEAAASGGRKGTRGQEARTADLQRRPNGRAFGDAGGARRAGHGVNG